MLRLFLFSLISWIPFSLYERGAWPSLSFSVLSTLLISLLMLRILEQEDMPVWLRTSVAAILCLLTLVCDWALFLPLMVVGFYRAGMNSAKRLRTYYSLAVLMIVLDIGTYGSGGLYSLGLLLAPAGFELLYNGERGSRHPFHKWFFYVFYPLHLLVLFFLKTGG